MQPGPLPPEPLELPRVPPPRDPDGHGPRRPPQDLRVEQRRHAADRAERGDHEPDGPALGRQLEAAGHVHAPRGEHAGRRPGQREQDEAAQQLDRRLVLLGLRQRPRHALQQPVRGHVDDHAQHEQRRQQDRHGDRLERDPSGHERRRHARRPVQRGVVEAQPPQPRVVVRDVGPEVLDLGRVRPAPHAVAVPDLGEAGRPREDRLGRRPLAPPRRRLGRDERPRPVHEPVELPVGRRVDGLDERGLDGRRQPLRARPVVAADRQRDRVERRVELDEDARPERVLVLVVQPDRHDGRWRRPRRAPRGRQERHPRGARADLREVRPVVAHALREERREPALRHGRGQGLEAPRVGRPPLLGRHALLVLRPVDRDRPQRPHHPPDHGPPQEPVARAERHRPRRRRQDQRRVDDPVRMPRHEQPAAVGRDVLAALHHDVPVEHPHQRPDERAERAVQDGRAGHAGVYGPRGPRHRAPTRGPRRPCGRTPLRPRPR